MRTGEKITLKNVTDVLVRCRQRLHHPGVRVQHDTLLREINVLLKQIQPDVVHTNLHTTGDHHGR